MSDKSLKSQLIRFRALPLPRPEGAKSPPAPRHLDAVERRLWRQIVSDFEFSDGAALAVLRAGLEAHQRMRRCRETIDREGESIRDKWGQIKAHPLLAAERDARAAFLAAMR